MDERHTWGLRRVGHDHGTRRARAWTAVALATTLVLPVTTTGAAPAAATEDAPWGSSTHEYRLSIDVTPDTPGATLYAATTVDFTSAFSEAGAPGLEHDPTTMLVHEVDDAGAITDADVAHQFDPAVGYDPVTGAIGELIVEVDGPPPAGPTRHFLVYFDTPGSGAVGGVVADQVVVETGLSDGGLPATRLATPAGDWWYQPEAGGFSSLLDPSGADWIGWSTANRSSGEFRGIPNLVYPAGYFHPGATGHSTTMGTDGPLRTTLSTTSPDGLWEMRWDVYPTHAVATVVDADDPYWFLYEGTPGGAVETASDFWADSSGASGTLSTKFTADLPAPEWIQFADPAADRSLFLVNHTDDDSTDSYRAMDDVMTVFGFGRTGTSPVMTGPDRRFTVGLLSTSDQVAAATEIDARSSQVTVVVGQGHSSAPDVDPPVILSGPSAAPTADRLDVTWATDEASTSEVAIGVTPSLELGSFTEAGLTTAHEVAATDLDCETTYHFAVTSADPSGNSTTSPTSQAQTSACTYPVDVEIVGDGTITRSPDQAGYLPGTVVTLTAISDPGATFVEWSGDATGTEETIDVVVPNGPVSVTATFTDAVGPVRVGGEVVLYGFDEGSGSTVGDSGSGVPLDLSVVDASTVSWGEDGLTVADALLVSSEPATKVFDAVAATNELSVEAWVVPGDVTQDGPARIVSSAQDPLTRNFMLGQGAYGSLPDDTFGSRVRTSSSTGGNPTLFTPAGSATTTLTHVVLTRSAAGAQTIYLDGVAASSSTVAGTLDDWDRSFPLSVANIASGDRPWNGTLCLVAVYDVELSAADVATNHQAGCATQPPAPNTDPVIDPVADRTDDEDTTVSLTVTATDPDGDPLVFDATGLPTGLTIDPTTGVISGTIDANAATGSPYTVDLTVDDQRGGTDTTTTTWTITPTNTDPVLDPVGDRVSSESQDVSVAVTASDADGDVLVFDATGLPPGLGIDAGSGVISGTVAAGAMSGSPYSVVIDVDDQAGGSDAETISWTVVGPNTDPVIDPVADRTDDEDTTVSLTVTATDPDGDPLVFDATGLPTGLGIDAGSGVISGTIGSNAATGSPYTVDLTVDDQRGGTDTTTMTWTVDAVGPVRVGGEVVLYGFDEGSGSTVGDSGSGVPLDLSVVDASTVSWGEDGLTVADALLVSSEPATKVFDAVAATNELSVEAWVVPGDVTQDGPARIVSSAQDPLARNFMLGQGAYGSLPDDTFGSRVRTSSSTGGTPTLFTPAGSATTTLTHVVLTRSAAGAQTIYLDGVAASSSTVAGTLDNWDRSFPLSVANIASGDRPWNGTLCLVAVYDVELSAADVATNHQAGCATQPPAPNTDPVIDSVADRTDDEDTTVSLTVTATDPDGDPLVFDATGLPTGLTIDPTTGVISGTIDANAATGSPYTVDLTVDDQRGGTDTTTTTWTITPTNTDPVATDDTYQTPPDTSLEVDAASGVLSNDDDPDLDTLTATLGDDVSDGSLAFSADGSFTYVPDPGFTGVDGFTYSIADGQGGSASAGVTLQVSATTAPPRIVTGEVAFQKQVVGTGVGETHIALGADLDGDDDVDIVATDFVNSNVRLYLNDGSGAFTESVLDPDLDGAYPAHVDDVDGDGDIDVLAAGYLADSFVWYENDGSADFTRHLIDSAADGAHSIVTVDVDGDGDNDLVTSSQDADRIAWYENDGSEQFTLHVIDNASDGAKRAEAADFDGDGDMDVVGINYFDDEIAWYENDAGAFTERIIDAGSDGGYFVAPADVDDDGDVDLYSASQRDDTIAWFENDGTGRFVKHLIDTGADAARSVIAVDIDGDGDLDAVAASVLDDTVSWYENDGTGQFDAHAVDLTSVGPYGVWSIDVDGDGDEDVITANNGEDTVAIQYQTREHRMSVDLGGDVTINATRLLTLDDDTPPAGLVYNLTSVPTSGTVSRDGVALAVGQSFTQADVDLDLVRYEHDGTDTQPDSFAFTVSDGGPPAEGSFVIEVIDPASLLVSLDLDDGEGATATDSSGNGNDGTLQGGAGFDTDTPDGSASSVRLDGSDDSIALPAVDVDGAGLTLALWFKADDFGTSDARLISKATGVAADDHVFMLSTVAVDSEIRLRARIRVEGTTTTFVAGSGPITAGQWEHAALTYDGVVARLYLDGVQVGSAVVSGPVDRDPAVPIAVGAQPQRSNHFDGWVDDVRILERGLGADEVAAIVDAAAGG